MKELLRTPARQLSLGQRMRCEIAASLLHSPRILFLDEPTIGLDAVSKLAVRDFIKRQNRIHGTTVILTTHDMQDIEALTKRIILIGKGRILMDGTLEDIKKGGESMDETLAELMNCVTDGGIACFPSAPCRMFPTGSTAATWQGRRWKGRYFCRCFGLQFLPHWGKFLCTGHNGAWSYRAVRRRMRTLKKTKQYCGKDWLPCIYISSIYRLS